jgi:hypothetical protein
MRNDIHELSLCDLDGVIGGLADLSPSVPSSGPNLPPGDGPVVVPEFGRFGGRAGGFHTFQRR